MKTLITGGAGYIGSVLTEELLYCGESVIVYDNLLYRQNSLTPFCHNKRFQFIHGDCRNYNELKKAMKDADHIIPLAAIVGAPACERDPKAAHDVNCNHVKFICGNKSKSQYVSYLNTNSGYGSYTAGLSYCTEETPLKPISYYGKTKCEAEKAVLGVGGVSLRLATVFGVSPRMRLDLLVNNFTYKAMDDGYLVLFEKDFKRNYIHIRDVVSAILQTKLCNDVFNVGLSSANISKYELALKIKDHIPNLSIQCDEFSADKDKRNYIISNEKLEKFGWQPQYTLDDGIAEIIQAYPMLFASQQSFTNL